ncbi:MAG: TatD family hydrolase [Chitinophagaceae bacterium]
MELIDTHCHLYLADFEPDTQFIINRAREAGVSRMYLPAIDSSELERLLALEKAFPGECIAMMGLHPCSVKENYEEELRLVESQLRQRKFAAVGEIGLDFYWDVSFADQQYEAFRRQIKWAMELDLPIVIHSRNSIDDCIRVVSENKDGNLKGIFHCFSGSAEQARQIIDLGFYLGIGGVITYKNAGLAEALKDIPLDTMVLETDAPYLTPVPFRGKRNESSYIKYVAQKLAEVKGVSVQEVAAATTANAQNIFRFQG